MEEDNKNKNEEEEEEVETPTTPLPEEIQAIMIKEEKSEEKPEQPEQPEQPEVKSEEAQPLPISEKDVDEVMEKIQPKIDQLIFYYWPILPKEQCHRWEVEKATAYFILLDF